MYRVEASLIPACLLEAQLSQRPGGRGRGRSRGGWVEPGL